MSVYILFLVLRGSSRKHPGSTQEAPVSLTCSSLPPIFVFSKLEEFYNQEGPKKRPIVMSVQPAPEEKADKSEKEKADKEGKDISPTHPKRVRPLFSVTTRSPSLCCSLPKIYSPPLPPFPLILSLGPNV